MVKLGATDLRVSPICLGSNIFGWTTDAPGTFAVLDAYAAAGGNFIDTADVYSAWVEGHSGGEAESLIGSWVSRRKNRDDVVIATKVGMLPGREGLSAPNIDAAVEDSLRRLGTDHIDIYYAHADDASTPLEETLAAFGALVQSGKTRYVGASNYTATRLAEALATSRREGLVEYVAVQPPYNLLERSEFEGALAALCEQEKLLCVPYFSLAKGFLTGKYRGDSPADTRRTGTFSGQEYMNDRGVAMLSVLDEVAAAHQTTPAAVSLAWLLTRPQVAAPIASARTVDQVADLAAAMRLQLDADEIDRLTNAGEDSLQEQRSGEGPHTEDTSYAI